MAAAAPTPSSVWVLDPIDGTKSFICGIPLFGTLDRAHPARPAGAGDHRPADPGRALAGRRGPRHHVQRRRRRARGACAALGQATLFCTAPDLMFEGADAAGFAALRQRGEAHPRRRRLLRLRAARQRLHRSRRRERAQALRLLRAGAGDRRRRRRHHRLAGTRARSRLRRPRRRQRRSAASPRRRGRCSPAVEPALVRSC